MKPDNYISFFTVCGFFIGIICAVCKFDDPFVILGFTMFTTFIFYILIHIVVVNFVDAKKLGRKAFDKQSYEEAMDYFINELEIREHKMAKNIEKVENELMLIKNQTKPLRKKYAKAA